jgi:hypothetical protein
MKPILFILFLLTSIILMQIVVFSGIGSAITPTCNATIGNASATTYGCKISTSFQLTTGNYNINATFGQPAIEIAGSNLVFDCNGSVLYGNVSGGTYAGNTLWGILVDNKNNVTIKNCTIHNYEKGTYVKVSKNVTLSYIVYNLNRVSVDVFSSVKTLINSTVSNASWVYDYQVYSCSNDTFFYNNFIYNQNVSLATASLRFFGGFGYQLVNNKFYNITTNTISGNISNVLVKDNIVFNYSGYTGFEIDYGINNISVLNNTIFYGTKGLYFENGYNVSVINNTISDAWNNYDEWNSGIWLQNVSNFVVMGNNVSRIGCFPISTRGVTNGIINNNYINLLNISESIAKGVDCNYEITAGISNFQLVESYSHLPYANLPNKNITDMLYSNNITIVNNQFGSNIQTYLNLQGMLNFTHDLTDFWYLSYRAPVYLVAENKLYNNLQYNNISNIRNNGVLSYQNYMFGQGISGGSSDPKKVFFNISKSNLWFLNNGDDINTSNIIFFSLSSAKISFSNGTNIYPVSGDMNITLKPNEYVYVHDNYQCPSGMKPLAPDGRCQSIGCTAGETIFTGIALIIPLVVILIVLLILGFKNGIFQSENMGDKLIAFGGSFLLFLIIIVVGIVVVSQIGGC